MADDARAEQPIALSPGYQLGWDHGYEAAMLRMYGNPEKASTPRKLLALGTLVAGLGSAAALVVSLHPKYSSYRPIFGTIAVTGILLGAVVGAVNVLRGAPTPNLGV